MHIIGHSLGAHISAFAGKTFRRLTGKGLGRITGLDPAGPCFTHVDVNSRLKATDADFVDVIHTDAGVYGIKDAVGESWLVTLLLLVTGVARGRILGVQ